MRVSFPSARRTVRSLLSEASLFDAACEPDADQIGAFFFDSKQNLRATLSGAAPYFPDNQKYYTRSQYEW